MRAISKRFPYWLDQRSVSIKDGRTFYRSTYFSHTESYLSTWILYTKTFKKEYMSFSINNYQLRSMKKA